MAKLCGLSVFGFQPLFFFIGQRKLFLRFCFFILPAVTFKIPGGLLIFPFLFFALVFFGG
jgi:hypothetical protein